MATCRNPECRNGLVPGLRVAGHGTHDGARPGAKMQWCAVPCPACRPQPKGPAYVPINRTEEEIADRWDLASRRAPYDDKPKSPAPRAAVKPNIDDGDLAGGKMPPKINLELGERIAAALEKIATRVEMLTGAVLELAERKPEENPELEILTTAVCDKTERSDSNWERMLGLLQQLVDNYKIAYQPCITPEKEMTGSSRKKGGSARKRGGTSAGSTG